MEIIENKQNIQLYFKELVKTRPPSSGIGKIKKIPDYVCDLFVYEPRNVEEAQLGSLFMLGKIENIPKNKYRNIDLLLNLLISVIKREFYSNRKRSTLETLEASLHKANLYLADFSEKGNGEWIGNLHFICGAFSKNTLHLSRVGDAVIKLFRGTTVSNIENRFPVQKKSQPLKTFNNIASGTIMDGDKIILATKEILNIAPITTLRGLSKGGCFQIIDEIKKLIENEADKIPMLCLALEAKGGAQEIRDEQKFFKENLAIKHGRVKSLAFKTFFIAKKIFLITFLAIYRIINFIFLIIKKLYKFLAFVFGKIFKAKLFRPLSDKIEAKTKIVFDKLISPLFLKIKGFFLNLKRVIIDFKTNKVVALYQQNKPAFFVASLIIILILILPLTITKEINYQSKINNFNQLSAEIQEVQKKTDEALIYQDKEKAKMLIQKNQALIAGLLDFFKKPPFKNNKEFIKLASGLQEKYQEQQDGVNNVKRITNLEEILDFSKSGFIINPAGMDKIKDSLYFYELESGILYKFNLTAEKNEQTEQSSSEKNLVLIFISAKDELRKMTGLENDQIIIFGQSGKVYLYDINTNEHTVYSLEPNINIEDIKDLKNFSSNFYILYVLDKESGNIIKYTLPAEEGVIKGTEWLSKTEELKNAQSMAVDGSVYILDLNGIITKYFKGEKTEIIRPSLDKPLAGENKIFIKPDFKNIYISDPKSKRLIIFNQGGEIINQYVSDEFSELKDFLVTKDEKEIYLLCGKKVYKLEL